MSEKQPWDKETILSPRIWSMPESMDVQEPETDAENHEPDVDHPDDHHLYFSRFKRNLEYIDDWQQYEVLELLKQKVDLGNVSMPWLKSFREDFDLKV